MAKKIKWSPGLYCGSYWENRLFDLAINMFKYEGLPESINVSYLEACKQLDGYIIWCLDNDGNLRALRGAVDGYDPYGFPTHFQISNPVLGYISGDLGKDGILDLNTKFAMSTMPLIVKYAKILQEIDDDLKVNLFNTKTNKIYPVKNEGQAQQIRHLLDTMTDTTVPAYIVSSSMRDSIENSLPIISNIPYLGKDLQESKLLTINEFYAQFGINGTPVAKRERLNVQEVESNNQQLEINSKTWMEPRQKLIENLEKVFGITGVTCSLNIPKQEEIEPEEEELDNGDD